MTDPYQRQKEYLASERGRQKHREAQKRYREKNKEKIKEYEAKNAEKRLKYKRNKSHEYYEEKKIARQMYLRNLERKENIRKMKKHSNVDSDIHLE